MLGNTERILNSKSKLIRISSEDKISGTNNKFTVLLPQGANVDNIKGFLLHSAEVPNVFPNVASYNNNYIISFLGGATETDLNLNVPVGYYLIDDLISIINVQIANQIAINGDTYTLTLTKTGIFPNERIEFNASGISVGSCIFLLSDNSIWPSLGVITNNTTPFAVLNGIPATAQNIPNLIGPSGCYIHSRTLCSNNLIEANGVFSVVDKINLDKPFGSTCYTNYNEKTTHNKYYYPYESKKSFRKVDINLRDRDGNLLELPDNFYFSMMIKFFYD
jgi:hypothetical protein